MVSTLAALCEARGSSYSVGKTWTTDALFRETPTKIARRREEGCITVEGETSALLAVGQFRAVRLGVLLYAGDDVSGDEWVERGWKQASAARGQLFEVAADGASSGRCGTAASRSSRP